MSRGRNGAGGGAKGARRATGAAPPAVLGGEGQRVGTAAAPGLQPRLGQQHKERAASACKGRFVTPSPLPDMRRGIGRRVR